MNPDFKELLDAVRETVDAHVWNADARAALAGLVEAGWTADAAAHKAFDYADAMRAERVTRQERRK